ncbi:MAG: FecR domain-containing protein [Bryobacterales bacterium]|nr:FecR domain-containing protein [Bryobacterales bacterium]
MFHNYKKFLGALAASIFLAIPAAAAGSAVPGTLNYVEGQVTLAGQPVTSRSVGSAQLGPNQVLQTGQGRAELLLTPGVFLRVGENSSVQLISPNLGNTQVQVQRGQAIVEVTEIFKDNNISVTMDGASTRLNKEGLYAFNADTRLVQVFDGRATVQQDDHQIDLKKDREITLGGRSKPAHFDAKSQAAQDPLYAWSNLRSEYAAQASLQSARNIFVGGGASWYGPGWYWDPYWSMYGFIPGDGIWYSPFGWPFYSPWVAYSVPGFYGGFYGRGFYGNGFAALAGHGHVSSSAIASRGMAFSGARVGGGFSSRGFAGGMHGGFSGGMHAGGGGRR